MLISTALILIRAEMFFKPVSRRNGLWYTYVQATTVFFCEYEGVVMLPFSYGEKTADFRKQESGGDFCQNVQRSLYVSGQKKSGSDYTVKTLLWFAVYITAKFKEVMCICCVKCTEMKLIMLVGHCLQHKTQHKYVTEMCFKGFTQKGLAPWGRTHWLKWRYCSYAGVIAVSGKGFCQSLFSDQAYEEVRFLLQGYDPHESSSGTFHGAWATASECNEGAPPTE